MLARYSSKYRMCSDCTGHGSCGWWLPFLFAIFWLFKWLQTARNEEKCRFIWNTHLYPTRNEMNIEREQRERNQSKKNKNLRFLAWLVACAHMFMLRYIWLSAVALFGDLFIRRFTNNLEPILKWSISSRVNLMTHFAYFM